MAIGALVVSLGVLGASTALALQTHSQGEDVRTLDVPGGTCCISGLAVDQTGGSLYATDPNEVERFEDDGSYGATFTVEDSLSASQDVAVDNSGGGSDGTIYIADSGNSRVAAIDSGGILVASFGTGGRVNGSEDFLGDPDAVPSGAFSNPCGLAVDPASGNLLVADQNNGRIWIFDSSGNYLGRIADSTLAGPCGLAFASGGDLFVRNSYDGGKVLRFSRASATEYNFAGVFFSAEEGGAVDVAVDTSLDHVYVDMGNQVREYDSGGSLVSTFGQTLCCSSAIAVNSTTASVYVAQFGEIKTFGPLVALPDASTGDATDVTGTTATLTGWVDAAGGPAVECEFEYATEASYFENGQTYDQSAPCEPLGPYFDPETVQADVSGLSPATTYHYRLHATSTAGGTEGEDRAIATDGPPQIDPVSILAVLSESAKLRVQITPAGSPTTYRVDYVADEDFQVNGFANAASAPQPEGEVGAGNAPVSVMVPLPGLTPTTKYRFRVVATNGVDSMASPTGVLVTAGISSVSPQGQFPGQGFLPENRAWELVSPPDKNGGDVMPTTFRTRASASGDSVGFASLASFAGADGAGVASEYISVRSLNPNPANSGWTTHAISPRQLSPSYDHILAALEPHYLREFSADGQMGILSSTRPLTDDPTVKKTINLYLRTNLKSPGPASYQLLTECPRCVETSTSIPPLAIITSARFLAPNLVGATPDFSQVAFESRYPLTSDAPDLASDCNLEADGLTVPFFCGQRLYEWSGGVTRLTGRVPQSPDESHCDDANGTPCMAADVSFGGGGRPRGQKIAYHVVSNASDGHSRVFFTQPTNASGATASEKTGFERAQINLSEEGRLFVRTDHSLTEQLNSSERTENPADAYAPAQYFDATPDGHRAYFRSRQALTDDAAADDRPKLYMYDASKPAEDPHNLTLISKGVDFSAIPGVIGTSSDGAYVYFIGQEDSGLSIFMSHAGDLDVVAPLPDVEASILENTPNVEEFTHYPLNAHVTQDGQHLLFTTTEGEGVLSSKGREDFEQNGPGCVTNDDPYTGTDPQCRELYYYTASTDSMQCVSCNPTRALPTGSAHGTYEGLNRVGGTVMSPRRRGRVVTEGGGLVFFSSPDPLVPRDVNGVSDAYVFDVDSGGVHLLSSGESGYPSHLLEISADGSDAFFVTRERLSRWDRDESLDLYDARVGGGFPEPSVPVPGCQGDSCQPPSIPLIDPTPASSAAPGPGNVRPRKKHRPRKHRRSGRKHQRSGRKHHRSGRKHHKKAGKQHKKSGSHGQRSHR
jgi:hypothetical protein